MNIIGTRRSLYNPDLADRINSSPTKIKPEPHEPPTKAEPTSTPNLDERVEDIGLPSPGTKTIDYSKEILEKFDKIIIIKNNNKIEKKFFYKISEKIDKYFGGE